MAEPSPGTPSEPTETIRFALDGVHYEIDLTPADAAAFRHNLAPYLAAGRRTDKKHVIRDGSPPTRRPIRQRSAPSSAGPRS